MKISILKRIEALEQRAKQSAEPPSLIMIHYDEDQRKWKAVEHFSHNDLKGNGKYKTKTSLTDRLRDYYFPAGFNGRVILDTYGNLDPAIYENLFLFDIEDLREGQMGEIAIQSITEPTDEKSTIASINAYRK